MLIVYSLAYAEMRVILARILWNFDFELCDESRGWMVNVKAFTLWEKEKLMMKIKIRGA
jgi:cytochrome P450